VQYHTFKLFTDREFPDSKQYAKEIYAQNYYRTTGGGGVPFKVEHLAHVLADMNKLRIFNDRCSMEQIMYYFFLLTHYIADAHVPMHCDLRDDPPSEGDTTKPRNGIFFPESLHGKIESLWDDAVTPLALAQRMMYRFICFLMIIIQQTLRCYSKILIQLNVAMVAVCLVSLNLNKGKGELTMGASRIEWTETTWNPITGCTKHSDGCLNCYAERMTRRLKAMGLATYKMGFKPVFHDELLEKPLGWKKSRMIFVNSMSDTFHEAISDEQILKLFAVMNKARWHTFQVLTKRSDRLLQLSDKINWTSNIWQGVTVEHAATRHRIEDLRRTGAQTKFLSIEPLLGALPGLNVSGIDWVIVGGESGPGARPMKKEWVTAIRDVCIKMQTPFFFKQWGGVRKKENGRSLDNKIWDEMPVLAVR
jgi:protein gp37